MDVVIVLFPVVLLIVNRVFAWRDKREARQNRDILLLAMEQSYSVMLFRDGKGNIKGVYARMRGVIRGEASVSGNVDYGSANESLLNK